MSSGIYIMHFEDIFNKFYVGYSIQLEARKNQHYTTLKSNRHQNSKLSEAFANTGKLPIFEVLEYLPADPIILGKREIYWIKEFDAYSDGFNKSNGGEGGGFGDAHYNQLYDEETYIKMGLALVNNPEMQVPKIAQQLNVSIGVLYTISTGAAHQYLEQIIPDFNARLKLRKLPQYSHQRKYSDDIYIAIFKDLVYSNDKHNVIAKKYNVTNTIVEEISAGSTHTWLKTTYPSDWEILISKKNSRRGMQQQGEAYPAVKDPHGNIFNIDSNAKKFALEHSLHPGHFGDLLRKKIKQHKGWALA